jgi:hypothetical protein
VCQLDGERVAARANARDVLRLPSLVGFHADDVRGEVPRRSIGDFRAQRPLDRELKVWAVTGAFDGGEKRKPRLIVKV